MFVEKTTTQNIIRYCQLVLSGALLLVLVFTMPTLAHAADKSSSDQDNLPTFDTAEPKKDAGVEKYFPNFKQDIIEPVDSKDEKQTPLEEKILSERVSNANPRSITSHKINFFAPFSYNNNPNRTNFDELGMQDDSLTKTKHLEAQFQLSFKAALLDVLPRYDGILYFGFTTRSFWQVYDRDNSSPFRETNYEPELFMQFPFQLKDKERNISLLKIGLSHESNGETIPLSRSWNRVYAEVQFESGDWLYSFKPWFRIPEDPKETPTSVRGDDNPDIDEFMGNFELRAMLQNHRHEFTFMLRNNLKADNKGAFQIDWTFPIKSRLKPYVQIFTGYGDSLIDYDHFTRRISIGFLLTDWL